MAGCYGGAQRLVVRSDHRLDVVVDPPPKLLAHAHRLSSSRCHASDRRQSKPCSPSGSRRSAPRNGAGLLDRVPVRLELELLQDLLQEAVVDRGFEVELLL